MSMGVYIVGGRSRSSRCRGASSPCRAAACPRLAPHRPAGPAVFAVGGGGGDGGCGSERGHLPSRRRLLPARAGQRRGGDAAHPRGFRALRQRGRGKRAGRRRPRRGLAAAHAADAASVPAAGRGDCVGSGLLAVGLPAPLRGVGLPAPSLRRRRQRLCRRHCRLHVPDGGGGDCSRGRPGAGGCGTGGAVRGRRGAERRC